MSAELMQGDRIVGTKQTLKALEDGRAKVVYVANNADLDVTNPVIEACKQTETELIFVETMAELGRACGIDVGAAVACVLKD